jgi:hypothetical protein
MRHILLFIPLLFPSLQIFSQDFEFDKGSGTNQSLRTGVLAIKFIQQNNLTELLTLVQINKLDTAKLAANLKAVSSKYPYDSIGVPMAFTDKSLSSFYYERNFCSQKSKSTLILLQIHLTLIKNGNNFFITNIEFRQKSAIASRKKELKEISQIPGKPPAPPAVF